MEHFTVDTASLTIRDTVDDAAGRRRAIDRFWLGRRHHLPGYDTARIRADLGLSEHPDDGNSSSGGA